MSINTMNNDLESARLGVNLAPSLDVGQISSKEQKLIKFWRSMPTEKKVRFLELKMLDLNERFSSVKEFSEAIGFGKKHNSWRHWRCCVCQKIFADQEFYCSHICEEHNVPIPQIYSGDSELDVIDDCEFDKIDDYWVDMLVNGTWKPVDTARAVKIIQGQSKCQEDNAQKEWPLSDNPLRKVALGRIHIEFKELLRDNWFTMSQLNMLIDYAVDELQSIIPKTKILEHHLDKSQLCFCFLDFLQLTQIFDWLLVLSQPIIEASECNAIRSFISNLDVCQCKERVLISEELSFLSLDEALLTGEMNKTPSDYDAIGTIGYDKIYMPRCGDHFVCWLSTAYSVGAAISSWKNLKEEKKFLGKKFLDIFESASATLNALNDKKREVLDDRRLLQSSDCCTSKATIQRLLMKSSFELSHVNLRIERLTGLVHLVAYRFKQVSCIDYRDILLPLLKIFMQDRLQSMVEDEERKKSDTLQAAFLAKPEEEARKNTTKGGSNMSSQQQKGKNKKTSKAKKNKSQKKPNNLKASHELYVTEESDEDDDPNAENLNPDEENLKLKEEFEAEERVLPDELKKLNMLEEEAMAKAEAKA